MERGLRAIDARRQAMATRQILVRDGFSSQAPGNTRQDQPNWGVLLKALQPQTLGQSCASTVERPWAGSRAARIPSLGSAPTAPPPR